MKIKTLLRVLLSISLLLQIAVPACFANDRDTLGAVFFSLGMITTALSLVLIRYYIPD